MGDRIAFFYGTLMAPPVLFRVINAVVEVDPEQHPAIKHLTIRPALLKQHKRHRVIDFDYPAILPEEGNTVRGNVVSGLTDGDLWRLDIFEGDQYTRQKVKVQVLHGVKLDEAAHLSNTDDEKRTSRQENGYCEPNDTAEQEDEGEEVEAETYIWTAPKEYLDPQEWDFEEFKREKMKAWTGQGGWPEEEADEGFADVDNAVAAGRYRWPWHKRRNWTAAQSSS